MNRNQERNLENHNPDPDLRAEEDHNTDLGTLNITNRNPGSGSTTLEVSHTKKLRSPSTGIHKYVRNVA